MEEVVEISMNLQSRFANSQLAKRNLGGVTVVIAIIGIRQSRA
jgi:hypothetical protein